MMHWLEFANNLEPKLREGDLDYCIVQVADMIRSIPNTAWHLVLNVDFTNNPQDIAAIFDKFFFDSAEKISLKALYTETNGFYINPDRWYFQIFGYSKYLGHRNYDWLAYSDIPASSDFTLTGMETLQQVYENDVETEDEENAKDYSDLLVTLRFQKLIERSAN